MHAKRPAEAPTDPVLTPRLVLTPVGRDDVNDLLLLYSDPVVAYWTGPWTRAAVEAWAADMAARWTADGVGKWMARDRSDGSLVGRGGFTGPHFVEIADGATDDEPSIAVLRE